MYLLSVTQQGRRGLYKGHSLFYPFYMCPPSFLLLLICTSQTSCTNIYLAEARMLIEWTNLFLNKVKYIHIYMHSSILYYFIGQLNNLDHKDTTMLIYLCLFKQIEVFNSLSWIAKNPETMSTFFQKYIRSPI